MPAFLYLYAEDTDATYQRTLQAGATIKDPFDNDWPLATQPRVSQVDADA